MNSGALITYEGKYLWQLGLNYLSERPIELRWLNFLPESLGTKHQRAYMLKSVKQFLKSRMNRPTRRWRAGLAPSTVQLWFGDLRQLVRWMAARNQWRFSQLAVDDILDYIRSRRARDGKGGPAASETHSHIVTLFEDLWTLRGSYVGSLRIDVRRFEEEVTRARAATRPITRWRPIDDEAARTLLKDSADWMQRFGPLFVQWAHRIYTVQRSTVGVKAYIRDRMLRDEYRRICLDPEFAEVATLLSTSGRGAFALADAFGVTIGAALNVLLFMVGMRVAEATRLNVGCVETRRSENGLSIPYIRGIAAKTGGKERSWVASEPVPQVLRCLEDMFRPARESRGIDALFLTRTPLPVPLLWRSVKRMNSKAPGELMKKFAFAAFRKGKPHVGRLHPHAARKTFATFVTQRDKTALESLALHFNHAFRDFTDGVYVGDIALEKLLQEKDRSELAKALSALLVAPRLAGRGAQSIAQYRSQMRFKGTRAMTRAVNKLIAEGVKIAPCDWGYCVYAPALSACKGDQNGPSEVNRSPDVCASCANFVVTERHLSWWEARARREEAFLSRSDLSEQARIVSNRRLSGSREILRALVLPAK